MSLPTGKKKRARKFQVGLKVGDIASTTVHILQLLRKLRETERNSVIAEYVDGLSEHEKDYLLLTILQCLPLPDIPHNVSSKVDDVTTARAEYKTPTAVPTDIAHFFQNSSNMIINGGIFAQNYTMTTTSDSPSSSDLKTITRLIYVNTILVVLFSSSGHSSR